MPSVETGFSLSIPPQVFLDRAAATPNSGLLMDVRGMAMGRKSGLVAAAIVVGLAVAVGGAVAIFEHFDAAKHDSIGVFDVQVDKERRGWVDIIFDRPISVAHPGAIIHPPPAT